jgi:hypothetical protein
MWRIMLPFLQFVADCVLGLGAFAIISVLICGIWEGATLRRYRRHGSFMA